MSLPITKAWGLLNRIREHRVAWNFGLGSEGGIEIDYDCIHDYDKKGNVSDLSKDLYLDSDLVLHVVKAFTEHIRAPKEGWVKYEPQPEPEKEKEVKATLASLEPINEIPFFNTVQKHIIEYEQVKEAQQKEEEESVPVVKEILEEAEDGIRDSPE